MDLHAESRIAVCGTGSTAEIVFLALRELEIEEIDFYEEDDDDVGTLWMRHISPEIAQGIIDYLNTAKEED